MRFTKRKLFSGMLVIVLISFLVYILFADPWSPIWCRHSEIDINSGKIRTTRYLLYCPISEHIKDSLLTETVGQSLEDTEPDWHRVTTLSLKSPGVSPHYYYHSAFAQIREMNLIWNMYNFSDEAKKQIAFSILKRWQADGNDSEVDRYFQKIFEIACEKDEYQPGAEITVEDLIALEKEQKI